MKTSRPKKLPPHQRAALSYFRKLNQHKPEAEDEYYILNEQELAAMRKIRLRSMSLAALIGAVSVCLYYLPIYIFPSFFAYHDVTLNLNVTTFTFNYLTISFSLILIFLEIFFLTRLNIWAVAETANASGFPDQHDPNYELHLEQLFHVGLETKNKQTLQFGIDPYEGVPRFYILLFTIWNLVKATLTNFFVKLVVVKIVARAELRQFADLVGVPVFAIWNAVAARRIIENAKVYIMAPGVIHQLIDEVKYLKDDENFRQNIFDALQYIAMIKRSFHHNHFLLVKNIIETFGLVDFEDMETDPVAFLDKIRQSDEHIKKAYSKLLVLGIFIDGKVGLKDRRVLKELYQKGIINLKPEDVRRWSQQFHAGKGLSDFIKA